jgi:hypothetical protein
MNTALAPTDDYVEIPTSATDRRQRLARLATQHTVPNAYRQPLPTASSAVERAVVLGLDVRSGPGSEDRPEPLFHSAHEALRFAVTLDGNPARPIQSRMVDATDGSRALAGLDAAAQAGMILNALEGLGKFPVAVMIASCAPRTFPCSCRSPCCSGHRINRVWRQAIDLISQEADRVISEQSERKTKASYALRSAITVKIYGHRTTFAAIADDLKIDEDTVSKHHRIVLRWLMGAPGGKHGAAVEGVEHAAWRDAETVLRNVGIVGG